MYVQAQVATMAAPTATTPANIPVSKLQIALPFLSYYHTAYYDNFVFVYVSCQSHHVAAFVCMYVCMYPFELENLTVTNLESHLMELN